MEDKFTQAINFAIEKHKSQKRKGTNWPYIVHIYDVMRILQENNADKNLVVAGILHDVVEDCGVELCEIEQQFGKVVADIVDVLSEKKELPYRERKLLQAKRVCEANYETKMVKCADCLSNLKSICLDEVYGQEVWKRFNSSKENIKKHYSSTIQAISVLENLKMYNELQDYYNRVFEIEN